MDVAAEMTRRGWRVVVLTSRRGYDDPSIVHPKREMRDGVEIRRLPLSSFGKRTVAARLLGSALFLAQAVLAGLFVPRLGGVLVSTSPPMAAAAGLVVAAIRRRPLVSWVMDLNPDQAVALGAFRQGSLPVRALDALNRLVLGRASDVVALDRFMADRLRAKGPVKARLHVTPPWPHDDHLEPVPHERNAFRQRHGLADRFVVEYSGNHSPAHPLATVLAAARRLQDDPGLVFLFVGGGAGKKEIDDLVRTESPPNVKSLPYQPLETLGESLSAADVHLVSMGDAMVGIVHPCKIYGAMAVGRPVLLVGPAGSHAGEIVEGDGVGWRVDHGDVDGLVALLRKLRRETPAALDAVGRRARSVAAARYYQAALCARACDVFEAALRGPGRRAGV